MSYNNLTFVYYAFFHSIASYGIIAWGNAYGNSIDLLHKLHSKIIEIIINNKEYKSNEYLKIPINIQQTYLLKSLIQDYQILKDKFINSNSKTRSKSLEIPRCTLEVGKKVYSYQAIKLYNQLPSNLKLLDINKKSSKYNIKNWIINSKI